MSRQRPAPIKLYRYAGGDELARWYEHAHRRTAESAEVRREPTPPAKQIALFSKDALPSESKREYRRRLADDLLRKRGAK